MFDIFVSGQKFLLSQTNFCIMYTEHWNLQLNSGHLRQGGFDPTASSLISLNQLITSLYMIMNIICLVAHTCRIYPILCTENIKTIGRVNKEAVCGALNSPVKTKLEHKSSSQRLLDLPMIYWSESIENVDVLNALNSQPGAAEGNFRLCNERCLMVKIAMPRNYCQAALNIAKVL